jgi:DNA-binding CsgD family transcriptional regulator
MPDLMLNDVEQRALRDLLATEPCPGSPLPHVHVLERLAALVPADGICAVFRDGSSSVATLGVVHWSRDQLAVEASVALEGSSDGVAIGFRNGRDGFVQIVLGRRTTPFTPRDLAMLQMLTPLLARLVRERPMPGLPVALTAQERRVLGHVAAGASNTEIAATLFIAPSTVRKHLENSYRKLGVSGRVAAVARMQGRDVSTLDLHERLARLG